MYKLNYSGTYMLPILYYTLGLKFYKNIVGSYLLSDILTHDVLDKFYIIYKYEPTIAFGTYENDLLDKFEDVIDLDDNHICVVIKIPEEIKSDLTLALNGKYSQISELSKDILLKFAELKTGAVFAKHLHGILYKSPALRLQMMTALEGDIPENAELGNLINLQKEYLILKNVINEQKSH